MATFLERFRTALPRRGWLLLAGLYAFTLVLSLTLRVNWGADSRLYLAWTYWYLGYSQPEAAQLSYDFLIGIVVPERCPTCWPPNFAGEFFTGRYAAVVAPRVFLPLVSAPLVALFGPNGMLVVSILCYAGAIVAVVLFASRLWGQRWALVAGLMMLVPVSLVRWAAIGHTEAAAILFTVWPLLFLPLARRTGRRDVVWFAVLVVLGMANRQFAIALPAAGAAVWLLVAVRDRRLRNPWLPFAVWGTVLGTAVLAVQMLVPPRIFGGEKLSLPDQFAMLAKEEYGASGVEAVVRVTAGLIRSDLLGLRFDLVLCALLALAAVAVVWRFRSELSVLAAVSFVVVSAIYVIQFHPSSFRYQVPIIPLLGLAVIALMADVWGPRKRRPSRSTEAAPGLPSAEPVAAEDAGPATAMAAAGLPATATSADEPTPAGGHGRLGRWYPRARAVLSGGPRYAWLLVVGIALMTSAVLQTRVQHFSPDSRFHLAWAYRFLGYSPDAAALRVYDGLSQRSFVEQRCGGRCWPAGSAWLFDGPGTDDPTVLYPLLSAPFVAVAGAAGLVLIPVVSYLVTAVLLAVFASRRWGQAAGALVVVVYLLSERIGALGLIALPDTMAMAMVTATLFTLPIDRAANRRRVVGFGVLLALAMLTRATAVALVAAVLAAWLVAGFRHRRLRNDWFPFVVTGLAVAAATQLVGTVFPAANTRLLGRVGEFASDGVLAVLTEWFTTVVVADLNSIAADAPLGIVLLVAVLAAVTRARRDPLAALALGGGLASLGFYLLDGVPSGVRSYAVVFPILLLAGAGWVMGLVERWRDDARPVAGSAPEPSPTAFDEAPAQLRDEHEPLVAAQPHSAA
ncbi:MAG TPA: glycosyltransferase family 39 protein, partial [Cryptosporangiaceae bacterium]|nr:glycosyltransferase family 39 protein [Cryptosporangiaceae bacterium]